MRRLVIRLIFVVMCLLLVTTTYYIWNYGFTNSKKKITQKNNITLDDIYGEIFEAKRERYITKEVADKTYYDFEVSLTAQEGKLNDWNIKMRIVNQKNLTDVPVKIPNGSKLTLFKGKNDDIKINKDKNHNILIRVYNLERIVPVEIENWGDQQGP